MFRFKQSRLRYRKCYFLLSAFSICLIIFYCIIGRYKQNLMLLKFFYNSNNNSIDNKRSSISKNHFQNFTTKKHVVDSNKQLRDWHNYTHTRLQVTRDHPQLSTSFGIKNKYHQQHDHLSIYAHPQQRQQQQQPRHQPQQDTILSLAKSKFGQTAITNSTYNLKLIENQNVKYTSNNNNNNDYNYNRKSSQLTGFNIELSESLPLQRLIPDTRHKSCKTQLYPAHLPSCSIIIIYHNEQSTVLLRTLYTIINQTPEELLKEIILVNDFSDKNIAH